VHQPGTSSGVLRFRIYHARRNRSEAHRSHTRRIREAAHFSRLAWTLPCSIRRASSGRQLRPLKTIWISQAPDPRRSPRRKRLGHGRRSGHAGLFSTAGDTAIFAQMILNGGIYAHHRLLARATLQEFTTRQAIGDAARTLGWTSSRSLLPPAISFPRAASATQVSPVHIALDRPRPRVFFVVLLTNRVNPTRANEQIRQLRPAVHDAILQALGLANQPASVR